VTNNSPSGTLKLAARIRHGNAGDFSLSGGTCMSSPNLGAGDSCSYLITLKGTKQQEGTGVQSFLKIKGQFAQGVCPAGDYQKVTVTLAGFVDKGVPTTR
jgi:hypothetical protein